MTIELPVSDEMKRRAAERERIKRSALPAINEADEATDTANEATSIANPEPPAEPEQVAAIAPATTTGRRSTAHPRAAARTPASDPESVLHANFEAEDWLVAACLQRPDALATIAKMVTVGALSIGDFYQPTRGRLCAVDVRLVRRGRGGTRSRHC